MKPINIIRKLKESVEPNFTFDEFKKAFEDKYGKGAYYYNDYYGKEYAKLTAKELYDTFSYDLEYDLYDNSIEGIMQSIEDDLNDMSTNATIKVPKKKVNEEYEKEISLTEGYEQFSVNDTPLNYKNELETKEVDKDTIDKEVFKELNKVLTDEDKITIANYGGYFIKDYVEGKPEYGTSDVSNSSFSEYVTIPVSLTVYWNTDNGTKEVPLEFSIREVYNNFNGGYN